jgi:hypothetical protein
LPEKDAIKFFYTAFLFVTLFLFSNTDLSAQNDTAHILNTKVSITFNDISLEEALGRISKAYTINFTYINNEIPLQKSVKFTSKDLPLSIVLDSIFKDKGIRYLIVGTQIVLKPVEIITATVPADSVRIVMDSSITYTGDTVSGVHTGSDIQFKQMDKEYRKYFFHVFGKRKVEDTVFVVRTKHSFDSIPVMKSTRRKYVYRNKKIDEDFMFSIGVLCGPGFSFRTLSTANGYYLNDRNDSEYGLWNICTGFRLGYSLNKHIGVRSGLIYTFVGEKGSFSQTVIDNSGPPQSPPTYPQTTKFKTITTNYSNTYHYILLPLMIGYTHDFFNRAHAAIYSGVSMAFFLSMQTTYNDPLNIPQAFNSINRDPRAHTYRSMAIVFPVEIDLRYDISKRVNVFITPGMNYFLSSIYKKDDLTQEHPFSFNLSLGIAYTFMKR